jgi:hypothetical protein
MRKATLDPLPFYRSLSWGSSGFCEAGGLRSDPNPGYSWPLCPGRAVGPTGPESSGLSPGRGPGGTPEAGLSTVSFRVSLPASCVSSPSPSARVKWREVGVKGAEGTSAPLVAPVLAYPVRGVGARFLLEVKG